ncbi:uncharacterized protein LOC127256292 [Andrographis paniculata]|uniref:uncharacterized protein LOC127256292 n=1 Tax=Andrographis paniculata TaxID=175694 RepID=UPI0021E79060|nr:uncharacterized protein LOC127256292 [Andrographis paniculata]
MDGLSSICAGLGMLDEDDDGNGIGYVKGEYCSDNLKDLLRFLRRDDPEKRDVFKQVCKWNIVGKDLIPLIEYCQEDRSLVLNSVKVLVFLTMPVEPTSNDIPQQIEYLWGVKSAITVSDIIPVITSLLETPLENLENESFTEEDWKLVQLVLTLFRNILAIQDISVQQKAGGSAIQFLSLRDRFLELLFKENVMDLILVLSQHTGGSHGYLCQDNFLFLDIFYYIFKGQDPELILKASLKGSKAENVAEDPLTSLQSIMKNEQEKRKHTQIHCLTRHSQFRGIYTRVGMDGSKALYIGNPTASGGALLKSQKGYRGPSKREVWDSGKLPSTTTQILQLLDDFISQFLRGGYNVLMESVRGDIEKDHLEIQNNEIVIFFQVQEFVTSFQYYKCLSSKPHIDVEKEELTTSNNDNTLRGSMCGPIAETLNEAMFQMVIAKWRSAFEGIKQTNDYKFLSAAGSLLKIMIRMLDLVLRQSPEDSKETQTVRILLYKLFYDQTEEGMTQFLLSLIKSFDTHKQSKSDLANLVESMHVILRLLENLQTRGNLRVSKKSRKKRAKKATTTNGNESQPSMGDIAPENQVDSSTVKEPNADHIMEKETSTHQELVVGNIGEVESVRDSIQTDDPVSKPADLRSNELEVDERNIGDNDGCYLETDNSSGDEQPVLTNEVDFKPSSLLSALANNNVVQKLCWLLKFYKNNSVSTNHYIINMLRRICDDLELAPMLYQLSYLTIFSDILEEQKARPCKEYENIVTFLSTLVRRMLRKMKSYPLLFVEVLFPKTRRECQHINCGSMLNELNHIKNEFREGRSHGESGGNGFSHEQKWVRRSLADALGDDDFVMPDEDNQVDEHTEEEPNRSPEKGTGLVLSDEMEDKLKYLYEKHKDDPKCCEIIAGELDPEKEISKVEVVKALTQLGFKVAAKAKVQKSNTSHQLGDCNTDLSRSTSDANLTLGKESSSMRKPTHSRKRVHAFSSDQEQKIKDLFEQFKDQKKCSSLIANALDSTGKISAALVSRKLKQLGLAIPKKKSSHGNRRLRNEVDISFQGEGASDDETLLSLQNRGKQKRKRSHYGKEHNNKAAQKLPDDISDDELLSSLVVKTKKIHSKGNVEDLMIDDSSHKKSSDETNSNDHPIQVSERDESAKSNFNDPTKSALDMETTGVDNLNELSNEKAAEDPILDDELMDDLEEEGSIEPVTTARERSSSRRRLRMVEDDDDDDDD